MQDPVSLFIIGIAAMLLLAFGIIFFVVMYQRRVIRHQQEIKVLYELKQQELINASIQGEEQERMRIASELHDDVGATLSSVRLFLHSAAKQSGDGSIIDQSRELLDDSIQKIRNISHKLQPSTLEYLGLQKSLQALAESIGRSGDLQFRFVCHQDLPSMHENVELSVYRIIQELTTNILKHAGATMLSLEIVPQQDSISFCLEHNGAGLTDVTYQELIYKKGAIGLKNIVNRLKSINASISFVQIVPDNFRITITTPVER